MTAWGFVSITLIVLVFFAILYVAVEWVGRAAERRNRTAAQEALDRFWKQNKEELRHDIPCPNCSLPFDAPDQTYFECPHCAHLLTTEWVKNYHLRKMKEEWENSFSGRFYRIAPETSQKR